MMPKQKHVIALSGGKDSAALAVYMREKHPDLDLEYVLLIADVNFQRPTSIWTGLGQF